MKINHQDAMHPGGLEVDYLTICWNDATGLTPSTPLKATTPCTVDVLAELGAVMPTVMVIDCGAVSGVPPFRLPPRCGMLQTMLFTAMPFNTPGAGAAQVTTPSAGWLEIAVTVPIVNWAGSEIVNVTLSTTVDVVLEAENVWVVEVARFICGFAELPDTNTATVGPGPPCGGACGVAIVKADEPLTGFAAASVPAKVAVPVTALAMMLTMIFTFTVVPAASVPMLQVTVVTPAPPAPQVPCPVRAATMFAPSGIACDRTNVNEVPLTSVAVLLKSAAVNVACTGTVVSAIGPVNLMLTCGLTAGVTAFDGVDSMLIPPALIA